MDGPAAFETEESPRDRPNKFSGAPKMSDTEKVQVETKQTHSKSTWKQVLIDYSEEATMHGVGHAFITKGNIIRRVVWFLALTAAFCTCTMMVINQIMHYYSYPIDTVETTVKVDSLEFPTVTICNYNRYMKSVLEKLPVIEEILKPPTGTPINWSDPKIVPYAADHDMRELMLELAHPINQTLLKCWWSSQPINCSEIFQRTTSEFDTCFSFNTRQYIKEHPPFTVNRRGASYGLVVELNTKQEEYYANEQRAAGFRVAIHGYDSLPMVEELAVPVSPGTETHLAVTRRLMKHLPKPYEGDDCLDTEGDFVNPLEYFPFYTFDGCRIECLYQYLEKSCNCVPFFVRDGMVGRPRCTLKESINCTMKKYHDYYEQYMGRECRCMLPCTTTQFSVSQAFALFPSDYAIRRLQTQYNLTAKYVRSNLVRLSIYYTSMNYQLIEQRAAYPGSSAIGDIGGQMGIFLGASILTLMELGDLFVRFVIRFVQRGEMRKPEPEAQSEKFTRF